MTNHESVRAWNRLLVATSTRYGLLDRGRQSNDESRSESSGHGSILGEGAHMSGNSYKQLSIIGHYYI